MEADKASNEEQPSAAQPGSAERVQVQRTKRVLVQVTIVDAQGQRRSGVPVTLKRIGEDRSDIDETTETDAFGKATIGDVPLSVEFGDVAAAPWLA